MGRIQLGIVVIVAAGFAVGAGTLTARWLNRNAQSPPPQSEQPARTADTARLSVPQDRLNVGSVWESEQFTVTLPIENQEPFPVEVESFSATCNCLSVEPRSFTLGSGERRELRLQLDLATKPPSNGVVDVRLTAKLKQETSSGKRLGPEWKVSGQVRRVLSVEQSIYLGRHSELSQPFPSKTVPVEALAPLASLSARSVIPGVFASVIPPASGSSSYSLVLTSPKPLPVGPINGSVILTAVSQGGESLPPRQVDVRGNIVTDLEAQPTAVQVGGRRIGDMFEEIVALRSLTGSSLGTVRIQPEGEGLTVEPTGVANEFRVRQFVRRSGTQTNRVTFTAELPNRQVTAVVQIDYTGLDAP